MNPMFAMASRFCAEAISSAPRRTWIPGAISVVSSVSRLSAARPGPGAQHRHNPPNKACRRDMSERPRICRGGYPSCVAAQARPIALGWLLPHANTPTVAFLASVPLSAEACKRLIAECREKLHHQARSANAWPTCGLMQNPAERLRRRGSPTAARYACGRPRLAIDRGPPAGCRADARPWSCRGSRRSRQDVKRRT
jgi:hypothetical protein